ncbi:MAG TPA: class I fructose-bisphosphate aldolase [Gammaproteobacteria bacterium]|nr:class I fructose-bisphosphate aldolase [Gammaproteobacteria bacterium]
MSLDSLEQIAHAMVAPGKGLLAADESTGTIEKRLASINVTSDEAARQTYRNLLFTAPGMADYISGVILYDETLRQSTNDGTPFPEYLNSLGVIPGIKVDKGAKPLADNPGEKVTEGLDGLRDRLAEYHAMGARFAKWRGVIDIGEDMPSNTCIAVNAHALARYAALCQEAGIVPIVEPEVLMDGDHDIDTCEDITSAVLAAVFAELDLQGVLLEGMILKPNMIIAGKKYANQADVQEVAEATIRVLKRYVPSAVPGIMFLSGGQSDELATAHLNAMNEMGDLPWKLSFSYGRALQAPALAAWQGKDENIPAAQQAFLHRAKLNGAAALGNYHADMEKAA